MDMKIRVLGCLFVLLIGPLKGYGQISEQRLSENWLTDYQHLNANNVEVKLEDALKQLESTYNVVFVYESGLLDGMQVVPDFKESDSFGKKNQKLLAPFNLRFTNLNKRTFIIKSDRDMQSASEVKAVHMVEGTITDAESGEVLPGVNVAIKSTSLGTSSGSDGHYSLDAPAPGDTLIFSFIGYETKQVPIQGRSQIDVVLEPTTITSDEVVVVGYGTQERESVISGITSVTEDDLEKAGDVPNLGMALTGKLPGVVTVSSTGLPGDEDPQIFIRGQSTWNDTSPLILVDGVERSLNNVDMSSVESVTVLKDASATAIYGVRGANGVILVQTKSGYEGQIEITGSFNSTIKAPSKLPGIKDSYNTLKLRNEAIEYELAAPAAIWGEYNDPDFIEHYKKPQTPEERVRYANVDWSNVLFKDYSQAYDANLNVRGGNEIVTFFASANYLSEGDLFKEFDNDRGYQ